MTTLRARIFGRLVPVWRITGYGPGKVVLVQLFNPAGPIAHCSMDDILLP